MNRIKQENKSNQIHEDPVSKRNLKTQKDQWKPKKESFLERTTTDVSVRLGSIIKSTLSRSPSKVRTLGSSIHLSRRRRQTCVTLTWTAQMRSTVVVSVATDVAYTVVYTVMALRGVDASPSAPNGVASWTARATTSSADRIAKPLRYIVEWIAFGFWTPFL